MTSPTTQFFARIPKSVTLEKAYPDFTGLEGFSIPTDGVRCSVYSSNGNMFAYANSETITLINPDTGAVLHTLSAPNILEIAFSPRGSYIMSWERPKRDEASGNFAPNLRLWSTSSGEYIRAFTQKGQAGWKLQFSFDEKYCARLVKNEIEFFETSNFKSSWARLPAEGCSTFSLSPGQNYSIAVFIPEISSRPASVRVYQIPNFKQPVSQKTFFKAEMAQMKWNKLGTALLVLGSTEVDKSGKSYYGETNLYLLGIAGSYDSRIQLDKEGTIHDFSWSPNSREFGVVYGYMPAKTTIFDARGNIVHSFPLAPRNTILFSPHGRFILVAGFGNLQGTVEIYDRQKQFSKLATFEAANTVGCEWSPDGKFILTATTSPRLRVDNGVKLWHYTGKLIYNKEYAELFSASWRPQDVSLFPLRSNGNANSNGLEAAPTPHESAAHAHISKSGAAQKSKPAGAYIPPHARNRTGAPSVVARTSLFQRELESQSISSGSSGVIGSGGGVIGGTPKAPPLSKAALKNKKKRESSKKHREDEQEQEKQESAAQTTTPAPDATAGDFGTHPTSIEDKKQRSLLKKLRAIQDLKARQANGDKLEDTQVKKIQTEAAIRLELAGLGWSE